MQSKVNKPNKAGCHALSSLKGLASLPPAECCTLLCRRFQTLEPAEIEALQLPETKAAVMALMHPQV